MSRRTPGAVLAVGAALLGVTACGGGSSTPTPTAPSTSAAASPTQSSPSPSPPSPVPPTGNYLGPPAKLPTTSIPLSTAAPPWPPPLGFAPQQTPDYAAAAGLPYAAEMLKVHYHAHLDIEVNGKRVTVPQAIGFVARGNAIVGLTPLHTHDNSGIIHIENSVPAKFVLGQVFVEWGIRFDRRCLGPYCTGNGKVLAVFVDGKRLNGDPTRLVLRRHQEIAIEYGKASRLPTPPSSYAFPPSL
jgi:hypothetical protein